MTTSPNMVSLFKFNFKRSLDLATISMSRRVFHHYLILIRNSLLQACTNDT